MTKILKKQLFDNRNSLLTKAINFFYICNVTDFLKTKKNLNFLFMLFSSFNI